MTHVRFSDKKPFAFICCYYRRHDDIVLLWLTILALVAIVHPHRSGEESTSPFGKACLRHACKLGGWGTEQYRTYVKRCSLNIAHPGVEPGATTSCVSCFYVEHLKCINIL